MRMLMSGPVSVRGSRPEQQDAAAIHAASRFAVAVIADGVSSSPTAGVCARVVARSARDHLAVFPARRRNPAPFLHATTDAIVQDLRAAESRGQLDLHAKSTVAAAVVYRRSCWTVTLGDSRVALIRDGQLVESTVAHTESATHHAGMRPFSDSRALTRWVSPAGDGGAATVQCWRVASGDAVLITSDGVEEVLALWRAAQIIDDAMRRGQDPADAVLHEIDAAGGAVDNASLTVLLIDPERSR